MVIQLVRVSIKPEQRDRWLELIRQNAAQTRAEEGCKSYEVSEDLEAPGTFVVVERWEDFDSQYEHFRGPPVRQADGSSRRRHRRSAGGLAPRGGEDADP